MRKLLFLLMSVVMVMAGQALLMPPAQAADTGLSAPQSGKIVSEEPGKNAPNILDGTVYSIVQVGNTIVVGGEFSQVANFNTSTILTRNNVFAFDATTGKVLTTFAPNPNNIVYKVQAAADGTSVYVGGRFSAAAGKSMPSRLFKADVATGTVDTTFAPPTISGDIRDLEVIGNRLWVAGKFTHIGSNVRKALGTINATTGKYDAYFTGVFAGTHRDIADYPSDKTNVLQISTNPTNTQLAVVGNFTEFTPTGGTTAARSQIAKFNLGASTATLSSWSTNLFTTSCSVKFETYMTDVEYSPDGSYFAVSTSGAWGGMPGATGDSGCDVVARFESNSTAAAQRATWTAYTGGDTTWTIEVTDNVIYAGGHQSWQNNPIGRNIADDGAVAREGIAALNPVNGMAYTWNPTRARGVGVQDLLATSDGLYVGSDTTLIGKTDGNKYHARIAFLPLEGGKRTPVVSPFTLPGDLYFVASSGSQLVRRNHSGTALISSANAPNGPGWGTSVGAFMVNGILYKANNNGLLTKQTFDGTTYGTASPVNAADLLANQEEWHADVKTITSLFYAGGYIYYTKSGTNALYRRGFETESDVVGQQRFSTTTSGINWSSVRGAFVANGLLYYADTSGRLWTRPWSQSAHAPTTATSVQRGASGWTSRTMFPYQGDPGQPNVAPTARITGASCTQLTCSFNGSTSNDWDGDTLTYSWNFGDGSPAATTTNASRTYETGGAKTVTLTVSDGKGHSDTDTVTVNPVAPPVNAAPTATITDASCTQLTCSFKGVTSSDPDGDTLTYSWDFGDTSTLVTTQNASRTYTSGGSKTVTLTVNDGKGGTDTDTVTVNPVAPPVNAAPTATITDASCTDLACSFKGETSSDPDAGDTLTYSWDFGDTSALVTTQNASRTYTSGGSKTVTLTVNDGKGGTDTDTVTVNPVAPVTNTAPTANITGASCAQLVCSFQGETSSDPDGDPLTYSWDFGDTSPEVTTTNASRTYESSGARTVTLTVNDGQGHSDIDTVTANPTDEGDPVSNVTYVGSAATNGNRTSHTVTLPSGIEVGDTMVLLLGAASSGPTYDGPAGWTLLESETGTSAMAVRAWTKTATSADIVANVKATVTSSAFSKSNLTVAVYRGTDGTSPIASSAAKIDNAAGSAHTSPGVTATDNTSVLVTYWADRSNDTTAWLPLVGPTERYEGPSTDTTSAHVTALLADSNGPVSAGAQGELTATANGSSSRGGSISILLKSS